MAGAPSPMAKTSNEIWGLGGQLLVLLLHDNVNYPQNKPKSSSASSPTITNRAQSTIAICLLILFVTLLLFALSNFDSSPSSIASSGKIGLARRWLAEKKPPQPHKVYGKPKSNSFALQGMGTLFRRGNRAMNDLLVAHLTEEVQPQDLHLFLRTLHRSSLTARADVVFVYPRLSSELKSVIQEENESFINLLRLNDSSYAQGGGSHHLSPFNATHFRTKRNVSEPLWGRGGGKKVEEGCDLSWGSVVGFDSDELDSEDSLAWFFHDKVPMQLRRWACYRMLLGRLRHNLKHVMIVGVKDVLILGDAFARVRKQKGSESVGVADNVILGGARAVRRLSDAMLTEIARVAIQRKNRKPHPDSSQILAHMVKNSNSALSRKVTVTMATELLPDDSVMLSSSLNRNIIASLQKEICSSLVDTSSVYSDC